jgi:hypothetical protein
MAYSKILKAATIIGMIGVAALITSCSTNPVNSSNLQSASDLSAVSGSMSPLGVGGPPGYEAAYVNDTTVLINAIEVPQNPTQHAQADFYEVVYPFDPATGQELMSYWPSDPQCSPCDHQGNGITPDDFHDHVLDSQPSNPGHGEYNALWAVYLIMPNYNNDAAHNQAVNEALQSMLPAKSEAAVDAILATQVDGMPLANEINTHFYFICDVVGAAAGSHQH